MRNVKSLVHNIILLSISKSINILTLLKQTIDNTKENAPHTKQEAFSTLIFNIINPLQRDSSSPWNEIILIQ